MTLLMMIPPILQSIHIQSRVSFSLFNPSSLFKFSSMHHAVMEKIRDLIHISLHLFCSPFFSHRPISGVLVTTSSTKFKRNERFQFLQKDVQLSKTQSLLWRINCTFHLLVSTSREFPHLYIRMHSLLKLRNREIGGYVIAALESIAITILCHNGRCWKILTQVRQKNRKRKKMERNGGRTLSSSTVTLPRAVDLISKSGRQLSATSPYWKITSFHHFFPFSSASCSFDELESGFFSTCRCDKELLSR